MSASYRWRDPARVSPQRLAELEAHDRAHPPRPPADGPRQRAAAARLEEFTRLREDGVDIDTAALVVGVNPVTAWRYETARVTGVWKES